MEKENIEDYKPFYYIYGEKAYKKDEEDRVVVDEDGNWVRNIGYYDRSWFCNETGNIHHNEKSVLNCPYCSKKYYKPEIKDEEKDTTK